MDTPDQVLTQLKKLREGVGLTASRLGNNGAVMSALGTSDPQEGYERIVAMLRDMGDPPHLQALRADFGLDLATLLQRAPTSREETWLGERRNGFATVIGRDVKTIGRWSDKAIGELRAQLLADQFTGDLAVVAAVDGDRILGCTMYQQAAGDESPITNGTSVNVDNPCPDPSMPCFIYGYPRDWRPASLTLGVAFRREPYPNDIFAVVGSSFFSVVFGEERYRLEVNQGMAFCRIVSPRRDRLYGIFWR